MTLPASGTISMATFNVELAQVATYSGSMSWVKSLTKAAQVSNSFNGYYSKAYYQRNMDGNCNNANCTATNCNCTGGIQCVNCSKLTINCANCDTQKWLQNNCNCNPTYNCTLSTNVLYDCNCNCDCGGGGSTCFPAGSLVLMADGSIRLIETIQAGEFVMGADGNPAEVVYLHISELATRKMFAFAEDGHEWSDEHLHWTLGNGAEWWWSANPDQWRWEADTGVVGGLKDNWSIRSGDGFQYAHMSGWVNRTIKRVDRGPETKVYLPVTHGVPIIVNQYVVAASADEFNYDYAKFAWNPAKIKKI